MGEQPYQLDVEHVYAEQFTKPVATYFTINGSKFQVGKDGNIYFPIGSILPKCAYPMYETVTDISVWAYADDGTALKKTQSHYDFCGKPACHKEAHANLSSTPVNSVWAFPYFGKWQVLNDKEWIKIEHAQEGIFDVLGESIKKVSTSLKNFTGSMSLDTESEIWDA